MIFSDQVKKYVTGNPEYANLVVSNAELGASHLLGTDTQGRDIFSHIINGGTSLILTAVLAGLVLDDDRGRPRLDGGADRRRGR